MKYNVDFTKEPSELQAKIDRAREEYRAGKYIRLTTHEEIDRYFDSL